MFLLWVHRTLFIQYAAACLLMKRKLNFVFLDEGRFLYDPITKRVYSFCAPHTFVGVIGEEFKLVSSKKDVLLQVQ